MADKDNEVVSGEKKDDEKKVMDFSKSDMMLLKTAEYMQESMEYVLRQLNSRKTRSEMKLKYSRNMPRQAEAMAKVILALHSVDSKSTATVDLATYLSEIDSKMPSELVPARVARIARTMRKYSVRWERSLTMRRR